MRNTFLEFEQPLADLENKIEQLRYVQADSAVDISEEIGRLQQKSQNLAKEIYSKLSPWQTALVARHPQRPYTLDYVREIFTDFHELHGDRMYADDLSIIGGMARFNGSPCMVIGHQKGRDTKERAARNFGMPRPGDDFNTLQPGHIAQAKRDRPVRIARQELISIRAQLTVLLR